MKKYCLLFLLVISMSFKAFSADITYIAALKSADTEKMALHRLLMHAGYEMLPIIKKKNLFYVEGKVGSQPVYFLLDTGSVSASILSDGLEALHLSPFQSDDKMANSTGGIKLTKKVTLNGMAIGKFHIKSLTATVMEQPFKHDLPTIVLGNEFFSQFNAIVDVDQAKLYLRAQPTSTKDHHQIKQLLEENKYQHVPLTKLSYGHFILPVQINDAAPVYVLFDTGTSDTTLSNAYVSYLHIKPLADYKTQSATDGTITFAEIKLDKIIFNPLKTFFATPIALTDLEVASANVESLSAFLEVVGIMGLTDMAKLHAVIDLSTQSVFFK